MTNFNAHSWHAQQAAWFHSQGYAKQEIYRHKKTGGIYGVVCNATRESNGELLAVYRNVETGEHWVRPVSEFSDGRFELVSSKQPECSAAESGMTAKRLCKILIILSITIHTILALTVIRQNNMTTESKKYGFYSERAKKIRGSSFWKTPEGKEVEVTAVLSNQNPIEGGYLWPDIKHVGEVTEWARRGTPRPYPVTRNVFEISEWTRFR